MIKIKVLIAEEGKIYTNGKIKGKVVWLENLEDIDKWKLVSDIKTNTSNSTINTMMFTTIDKED